MPPYLTLVKSMLSSVPRGLPNSCCSKTTWFRFQEELILVNVESESCLVQGKQQEMAEKRLIMSSKADVCRCHLPGSQAALTISARSSITRTATCHMASADDANDGVIASFGCLRQQSVVTMLYHTSIPRQTSNESTKEYGHKRDNIELGIRVSSLLR